MLTFIKEKLHKMSDRRSSVEKAIDWIKKNRVPNSGILAHHRSKKVTPEVTGYTIASLHAAGEKVLAYDLARWEASIQKTDGSFVAPGTDVPYTFDTAQVVRGFLAMLDEKPEFEDNIRRACDFVDKHIDQTSGEVTTPSYATWRLPDGTMLSEYGNLYVLPPMLQAGKKLNEPRYIEAAKRGMNYFRKKADLVEFKPELATLSHYFGYMMEALVDLGEFELAKKGLQQVEAIQKPNGAIPAYPGVEWVCSTGMAQLAIAWYKLGIKGPADKALAYLETLQNPSGGFYGSYGKDAQYFPGKEISWAVKFFLDAHPLKIKIDFDEEVHLYSEAINENDGRVQTVLSFLGDLKGKKILDIGCGKGRFLKVLKNRFPGGYYYGLDISEEMLKSCPQGIETSVGSMLSIQYPNDYFDCVYSVEALEHAVNVENAIREMARILKPRGKIIIIDKNINKLGALKIKSWEKWFSRKEIVNLLGKYGINANDKFITYNQLNRPDGLFVAWEGVKNA